MKHLRLGLACLSLALVATTPPLAAENLPDTIARVKPSIVGIATLKKGRTPPTHFIGTGFVVGDGRTVITNAHVIRQPGVADGSELLGIITVSNQAAADIRAVTIVNIDTEKDIAQLRIAGMPLPAMKFSNSDTVREGDSLVFTGFPLGMVLGFHHVTHRALVAAITPVADPAPTSQTLNPKMITQLRKSPYYVFQLDGTAYPGSSGSPLYDPSTGEVMGIVNKVAVKGTKESALSQPTGITYAIPGKYIQELLDRQPGKPAAP